MIMIMLDLLVCSLWIDRTLLSLDWKYMHGLRMQFEAPEACPF